MEFSGRGFQSRSGKLSIATSKNPSVVNTIYIYIHIICTGKQEKGKNDITSARSGTLKHRLDNNLDTIGGAQAQAGHLII